MRDFKTNNIKADGKKYHITVYYGNNAGEKLKEHQNQNYKSQLLPI